MKPFALSLSKGILWFDRLSRNGVVSVRTLLFHANMAGRKTQGKHAMFVVISRFTIANDKVDAVREAFKNRPHQVEQAAGFVRMEVMSPTDQPAEIWLKTYWQDEASFSQWHRSHAYHEAHQGIPKGLKLLPGSTEIRHFEIFAE